ncbi:vacuolar protein sorting-associated protein vps13 [Cryptococcus deuterogattii 99/473]|uniref:Vacuolar protein sorting-associated protein n=1 Tax=Cryptococcus deuterogattii Ram5 TaxID=1296110 RepID=A0A0D0V865_9TREE|nr:vacuolar protein sorting-associated protein vps13 [Cryptococcus deuterogattii Ram5]KIY60521.1 vacuolar protein sorting-associated protein vps13 [Cryptococcus deuterogattii 99/473]
MQALKNAALGLLNVYVSPYVENLNAQDLSLSLFNGNLQFHGLHLKKSLLERFGVPVEIVAGDIGTLSISIPWTALKTQPVKIVIDDVYVLARARPPGKVDPEEDERVEQATKQEKLKSAEAVDSAASQMGPQGGNEETKQTYVGAIVSKVVDNVQIHVKGIHIRYEDGTSTPEHPFAAGLTLNEFKAVSTDANWVEAFIHDSLHGVHKLVQLEALAIYFDTDTESLEKGPDRSETIQALKDMLDGSHKHQYILKPVTGEARAIINKHMSNDTPKFDAQVIFDEIGVVIDRDQYRDVLSVIDVFHFYRRTHQYHKFRPSEEEFKANPAQARLKFALEAIRSEVHERNRRWSWAYLQERRDTRKQYVDLFVKKLALPEGKQLPVDEAAALSGIEVKSSYEDIRFFRSVARAKAKKDAATRRKMELERQKNQPQTQTWGQWLWGSSARSSDIDGGISEEEKKELDDIIDYDSSTAQETIETTPRDFMRARVSAKLNKGSFSLRTDPHGKCMDVMALVFDSFSADATQFTDSMTGKLALGGFRVYDGTTPDTLYPQIVRVKDFMKSVGGQSRQTGLDEQGIQGAINAIEGGLTDDKDPFFVMEVEHNPLDGRADNAVTVKMRHLEIIYHRGYVEAVVRFFKPPQSQLESIGALLDAAGQTLDGIRKETRAGLEYALEQHKTIDLRVDMNAPIIIIPMDVKVKQSQTLVLDAGHIFVGSKLADKGQLQEVQSKRGRQYNEDDYKQLEVLMYDRLDLRLESTQLLMGDNIEACMRALEDTHSSSSYEFHILERISMSFTVQNAIVNAPYLTRFKVAGELPGLHLNFSDRKYQALMKFIDVSIPRFEGDQDQQERVLPATAAPGPKHFGQREIEEYNFEDDRSIISARTAEVPDNLDDGSSSGDKGDRFYEAHDQQTESQKSALRQVTFEFSFSVGKLQASLFKSVSSTAEKPLADAVLEGFGLTFALRKWDMSVDLFLRSVTLAMIEQGSAPRLLLSSASEDGNSPSDLKLVQVKYIKVQKDSPEFMTKHEGVDTSIDTELSTFKFTISPEPILSLYDFIMTTFVPNNQSSVEQPPQDVETQVQGVDQEDAQPSTDKMRIRVKLTSAQVALENNANKFALLALPSADVAILLRSGGLRVGARLGNLSLEDLSEEPVADTSFKKLLSIEGGELADFSYETFDPTDKETFPGYNSSVNLRAGSFKFTFMEKPISDLYAFATKFARMKAVYDAAQQAAVQRASGVTRMHFDVVIKTPIIVLPRDGIISPDRLILRLGEIIAKNEYFNDPDDTSAIDASLRGISVASEIMVGDKKATLQMINDVAITASIKQADGTAHRSDPHHADTEITTTMSDVKLSLTQRQYMLLMSVLEALPRALNDVSDAETPEESLDETPEASTPSTPDSLETRKATEVTLEPELVVSRDQRQLDVKVWTAFDFVFTVDTIALEIYNVDAITKDDLKSNSIARFALVKSHLGFKRLSNGASEAEFSLKTLSFSNTRTGNSVFRDIIPLASHEGNQVMLQYTMTGGSDPSALAIVTVDSPQLILAVDPLASLLEFAVSPFTKHVDVEEQPQESAEQADEFEEGPKQGASLSFRVEVVKATVVVIADDTNSKTQAIQLSIREILLSQQSILALKIDRIGMSFGRMDRPNDRVKFLDDLSMALSLDTRRKGSQQMTSFEVEIPDPVIFRASYTNIMLIIDIVNKATTVAAKALAPAEGTGRAEKDSKSLTKGSASSAAITDPRRSRRRSSVTRRTSISKRRRSLERAQIIISKEQLNARVNGFQFVLVGDLQEMPMAHLSTNEFNVSVQDWSGDLKMATSVTTSIRYFNLINSYFEPLVDPWNFDLTVNRVSAGPENSPLNVKLSARERLEVNLTSAFIELAITTMTVWSKEGERAMAGRGSDAPFRVRNLTGLSILIWPEATDLGKAVTGVKRLDDGADVPWRFEDRKHTRENISAVRHNSLGIQLQDTPWDPLRDISVDREGDHILTLRPRLDRVSHQITCEIKLVNNIKVITFRSTLNVENKTSLPVEMIVVDSHGKAASAALKIDPGESCPLPLEAAFEKRFRLRPLRGFGFDFSWSAPLHWKTLLAKPIRPISCKHQTPKEPAFYFQAQANFDAKDPAARIYPRMTLVLRAPVELENLLPYDLRFRVHDKNSGLSSSSFLVKGGSSPIHTVELSHMFLLNVTPEETSFKQSEYAIINTDDPELPIEDSFQLTDQQGLKTTLKLHYTTYPNSGGAFKVQIYSPFIFMNKTGLPFDLAAKTWAGGQRPIAGRDQFENDWQNETPTPFLFSFPNEDRHNRLHIRVNDSKWSQPVSFEPISADMQIVVPSASGDHDNYVGLSYAEGIGKYKLTKVITIAPRFLVKNIYSRPIKVRQYGTRHEYSVGVGERVAIHQLQHGAPPQLAMAFDEPNVTWSAPFNIADLGRTNITAKRQSGSSSIFLYVSKENDDAWPLRLRNETDLSLAFQQIDYDPALTDRERARPVHLLPPRSVQNYAWDWPTAGNKRIRLYVDPGNLSTGEKGVELPNAIDMMAIGIQPPMKVPSTSANIRSATVSIDVRADGGSQLLTISPYNEETSVYKPTRPGGAIRRSESTASLSSSTVAFETISVSEKPTMNITVELEGIGISVISRRPDELLYISLRGLKLGYSDYPQYYDVFVDCKWIQIDNQLFGGLFPIIFYPTVVPKDGKELESHPTLQSSVTVLKDQSHGVIFVKYATILLQAMTIEMDEDFLFALLDFVKFKNASWKEEGQEVSTRNPFYYALNALTMTLGNVNAAPLAFRALFLENVRLSIPSLQERVILHYQEQFVSQIYRVLGSADFLGNPVGLFNNISSGFSDIFYEPYHGMVMHGNKDIGLGIARGATSFAKKTVFGISDSVTKFTGSIGKGLSAATLDVEFQNKRRMTQRRNKPKHALYGVAAGASAFADSVTSAFEGVASKPMEGAEKGGAAGFAKGVGKGFVGLFTKPAVGVMDFLSASTEGIRNTTTVFDQAELDRVRLPRYIASDGVLRPFSAREALGQSWLKDLDAGAFFHDSYIAHIDLPGDDAISILSNNRILQVQLRKLRVIWQVPFEELQSLSLEANGINLVNRDGRGGPFLPIPDQKAREWYFKQIGK